MSLYTADDGRHGYTRRGGKAHRLYRVAPFPQAMTSCTSTPVVVTFPDDEMPDRLFLNLWCLHCYPDSGAQHSEAHQ